RDLRAAQADLAVDARGKLVALAIAYPELDVCERPSGGADLRQLHPGLHQRVAAAGFGEAVGVDVAAICEQLRKGADPVLRRLLAAPDAPAEARDVVLAARLAGENAAHHDRRHPGAGH